MQPTKVFLLTIDEPGFISQMAFSCKEFLDEFVKRYKNSDMYDVNQEFYEDEQVVDSWNFDNYRENYSDEIS